jgi:transmembrane sensor
MENKTHIEKWLNGTLTDEEEGVFRKSVDFKDLQKLLQSTAAFKAPGFDVEAELTRLKTIRNKRPVAKSISWVKPFLRVAAVFVIFAVGYFFFDRSINYETQITTQIAETSQAFLPDSSIAKLNVDTKITYSDKNWDQSRKINLDGEAYFKVAKGARFDVITTGGVVSVLGTQFNVKQRENYFEVVCFEGLVSVEFNDQQYKLPAGNGFRVVNGAISSIQARSNKLPQWMDGVSTFESIPFVYILEEFQRQYNVSFEAKGVDMQQLFTGGFTNTNIDLALKSITKPFGLTYRKINTSHIVLTSIND